MARVVTSAAAPAGFSGFLPIIRRRLRWGVRVLIQEPEDSRETVDRGAFPAWGQRHYRIRRFFDVDRGSVLTGI